MLGMGIIVVTGDDCDVQSLKPALSCLEKTNGNNKRLMFLTFQDFLQNKEWDSSTRVIFIYDHLGEVLQKALRDQPEIDINTIVQNWQQQIELVQQLFKMHRDNGLLFRRLDIENYTQDFLQVCSEKLNLKIAESDSCKKELKSDDSAKLFFWIAKKIIELNPTLQKKEIYLQALTWPLSKGNAIDETVHLDMLSIWLHLYKTKNLLEAQKQKTKELEEKLVTVKNAHQDHQAILRQENGLLLDNMFKVQEELEQSLIKEKSNLERLNSLETKLKDNIQEHSNLIKQLDDRENKYQQLKMHAGYSNHEALQLKKLLEEKEELQYENQSLLENLLETQEELARAHLKLKELNEKTIFSFIKLKGLRDKKNKKKKLNRDKNRAVLLEKSAWFDKNWYLGQYQDIANDPVQSRNPALHYLRSGGFEGRNPSPKFDSSFYLQANPDVSQLGMNPLWHYLQYGQLEGRQPLP